MFLGRHAFGVPGLTPGDSARLLWALLEESAQPPHTYEHSWAVGDLVLWDQRAVNHRARPFDRASEARILLGTRIQGDLESESAVGELTVIRRDVGAGAVPELIGQHFGFFYHRRFAADLCIFFCKTPEEGML